MTHDDFAESEFVRGLPGPLPAGEDILWQGEPRWWRFAVSSFHVRVVAAYFFILVLWRIANGIGAETNVAISAGVSWLVFSGAFVVGGILLSALAISRTTVYTITTQRVVMRIGVVLQITVNLPFKLIQHAALKTYRDGTGDISLSLTSGDNRLGYLVLWPHARPWRFERPEPMMRYVPDAARISELLAEAMQAAAAERARAERDDADCVPAAVQQRELADEAEPMTGPLSGSGSDDGAAASPTGTIFAETAADSPAAGQGGDAADDAKPEFGESEPGESEPGKSSAASRQTLEPGQPGRPAASA